MQIDRAFSEPTTTGDDTADYVPTQVIAELFKNEGYDGIAYKSAFGKKGHNVVLFDPTDAELTNCTLFEAESIKFSFEQSDNPYWVEKDGTRKSMHVADVRPKPPSERAQPRAILPHSKRLCDDAGPVRLQPTSPDSTSQTRLYPVPDSAAPSGLTPSHASTPSPRRKRRASPTE